MGATKRLYEEMQEANSSQAAIEKIAEQFDISTDELGELEWEITPDQKDGMMSGIVRMGLKYL